MQALQTFVHSQSDKSTKLKPTQLLDTEGSAEHSFSEFCCLLCVAKIYDELQKSDSSNLEKKPAKEAKSTATAKETNSTAKTVATRKKKDKGRMLLEMELLRANRKLEEQVFSQGTRVNSTREARIFILSNV